VNNQDHFQDDIPAYSLGALDSPGKEELEIHLAGCKDCQEELRAYQDVIGVISLAAPIVEPPVYLKQKILSEIAQAPAAVRPQKQESGMNFWTRMKNGLRLSPGMALGSAVMIVVLLVSNLFLLTKITEPTSMQRSGYSSVILNGTSKSPDAKGLIVYTTDGKNGFLVVNGLASLPGTNQYQLWLIKKGQRTNGGVFSVDPQGYHVMEVDSSQPLNSYDSFGITIEPFGGSPGPTGAKVLGGKF
jgi:anti-sigma-K factor RskA